jgi:pilus assembly protein CpaF
MGEVRDGHAGLSLFRAMMTGHSGASTFHADSPHEAIRRLTTVLGADTGMRSSDAIRLIAEAVDLLVQIGIRGEVRRVTVIANIAKELKNGDIGFEPIFRFDDQSTLDQPRWEQTGMLRPRILAETSL